MQGYDIMLQSEREELIGVEDIFENDELVLMKATFKPNYDKIVRTSVGIKDEKGDIVRIITVDEKFI